MIRDPRQSCRFAAMALGMQARSGSANRDVVGDVLLLALLLDPDDLLATACSAFARAYVRQHGDAAAVRDLGSELIRDVERSTWPDPSTQTY